MMTEKCQGLTHTYRVQEWLGEGCFGRVAKCQTLDTNQTVAVKILKDQQFQNMEHEMSMMEELRVLEPVRTNIVHFVEHFHFMDLHCLAFEMLQVDLYSFMLNRNYVPLQLSEIRPIAHQLLVALDALKELGIIHTDIKPDNVMFMDLEEQPLRLKLIDFGEAMRVSQVQLGTTLQPFGSRAPEVTLGLLYTEAIDVWGVGCLLAFLYLGDNLFPVNCEYQVVKRLVALLGLPPDHLLQAGLYSTNFFTKVQSSNGAAWRLLTSEEYAANHQTTTEEENTFKVPSCLDDLVTSPAENSTAKVKDRKAFIDLLKGLLSVTEDQRLTPSEALQHTYITMGHLRDPQLQGYFMSSEELMSICPAVDSSSSPPEDQTCVSDLTVDSSSSPPEDQTCFSDLRVDSSFSPPEDQTCVSDLTVDSSSSPPEDQMFVSDVEVEVQTDAPESAASTDRDSGFWSVCGQPSSAGSLTVPPSCWDVLEPIHCPHSSDLIVLHLEENHRTAGVELTDADPVTKPLKCSFFRRVRRVLRRVRDALCFVVLSCCCVLPEEDH